MGYSEVVNDLMPPVFPVAGRSCNGCAMCCKLGAIAEVEKPEGKWCQHCSSHKSCDIYASRPKVCRTYYCFYLLSDLGEEWKPSTAKLMVSTLVNNVVNITVDASRPDVWKKEPYFSMILRWSTEAWVVVMIDQQVLAVYPDRIDDLGSLGNDYLLAHNHERTAEGTVRRTRKVHKSEVAANPEGFVGA